ncbi:MAG: hypothetical protein QME60_09305, partial [Verrucomicrobiota bacterium]|nr:hypothetical protein [Verrucomicrobiota bacterium]
SVLRELAGANSFRCPPAAGGHLSSYFFRFNQACERTGVGDFLRRGEVPLSPSELVGRGLYWVVIIGVPFETARLLDIRAVMEFRQRVVVAMPALLSAMLTLIVGLIAISFLSGLVRTIARNAGSPLANLWSRIVRWVSVIMVLAIALEQAEIRGSVMIGALLLVIAAVAFGIALSFALGCKDMARSAMEKWIANLRERHRDASKPDMEG